MAESVAYARRGFKGSAKGTKLQSQITSADTVIPCIDLSTWVGLTTNGPGCVVIDRNLATEEKIEFTGLAGNSLTGCTRGVDGTGAAGHSANAPVEHCLRARDLDEANAHIANPALDHHTQYVKGATLTTRGDIFTRGAAGVQRLALPVANRVLRSDGTDAVWGQIVAADITPDTITANEIALNAITASELADNAVDNAAIAALAVTTAKVAAATVTPDKLALGPQVATVTAIQSTSSTSFVDLTTAGPAVTLTVGANGLALVILTARIIGSAASGSMGVSVSGASTVAPAQASSLEFEAATASRCSRLLLLTGLTPGSTTFTAKYAAFGGGSASFQDRQIVVIPL